MCEPATLALIGTGIAVAGTAVTGYMGYQQKRFEGKVQRANATAKSAEVARSIDRRDDEQRNLSRRYASLAGSQRASMAANGVDIGFGSAADTLGATDMLYGEDAGRIAANSNDEIRGIDLEAANYRAGAKAAKSAATGILVETGFDMASTILGGAAKSRRIAGARSGS